VPPLDEALAQPLRDDALLRTVREIGLLTAMPAKQGGRA